jgi:uncharacterized membrane protein YgcG
VLLLPTTEPETIEQFGIRLAEAWKIGRKGADDGLIIIVAKDDRRMRIEVGYGLEGRIPDAIASRIVNERMAPAFRQGDFFGGLDAAIAALDQALGWHGEAAAPAPVPSRRRRPMPRGLDRVAVRCWPSGPACCARSSACSVRWPPRRSAAGSASWSSVRHGLAR